MQNNYKQTVINFYNRRTNYDNDWTRDRALKVIELIPLQKGQTVLDVATGTAIIAIAAAQKVGAEGKVIGVDFTPIMLAQAREKIQTLNIKNIELITADAEEIDFNDGSFDVIICSYAIVLFSNIPKILQNWYRFLKPGGLICFTCWHEDAYFTPIILEVCARHDIILPNLHAFLGTPERCYNLLDRVGFKNISVTTEQLGKDMTLEEAKNLWQGEWFHPQNPLSKLTPQQIEPIVNEYKAEIEKRATPQGVWQDITTYYVMGYKL